MKTVRGPRDAEVGRVECDGCKAVMECAVTELRLEGDRDGNAYVMKCPHCGHETWVNTDVFGKGRDEVSLTKSQLKAAVFAVLKPVQGGHIGPASPGAVLEALATELGL